MGSSRKAWLKITIFVLHSPFLLPSFLGGKRKGKKITKVVVKSHAFCSIRSKMIKMDNLKNSNRKNFVFESTIDYFAIMVYQYHFRWLYYPEMVYDPAERHGIWSRFLLFILLFFFHLFLGGKRKGEKNNQSLGQNSCLSARSISIFIKIGLSFKLLIYDTREISIISIQGL